MLKLRIGLVGDDADEVATFAVDETLLVETGGIAECGSGGISGGLGIEDGFCAGGVGEGVDVDDGLEFVLEFVVGRGGGLDLRAEIFFGVTIDVFVEFGGRKGTDVVGAGPVGRKRGGEKIVRCSGRGFCATGGEEEREKEKGEG